MTTTATARVRCIADIARVHAREQGVCPALTAGGRTVTFSAFYRRAEEVVGASLASGAQPQDRIALIDHNGIETLEVVFGAALLNAVVVNVNWRLAPPEILQILGDARAGVIGVPEERRGEAVKSIVVVEPGSPPPSPEVLIASCHDQLAGYKCPKTVDFASTLPRSPSGKLLKRELRAPYWEGAARQVG